MKIHNFLVCDDIRNEIGNKHSLMGVYDDRIIFNVAPDKKDTWPKQMRLGFFTKIGLEDVEPNTFVFKIKYNDREQIVGEGEIGRKQKEKKKKSIAIAVVHNSFQFDQPGYLEFLFEFYNIDKELIGSITPDFKLQVDEVVVENN